MYKVLLCFYIMFIQLTFSCDYYEDNKKPCQNIILSHEIDYKKSIGLFESLPNEILEQIFQEIDPGISRQVCSFLFKMTTGYFINEINKYGFENEPDSHRFKNNFTLPSKFHQNKITETPSYILYNLLTHVTNLHEDYWQYTKKTPIRGLIVNLPTYLRSLRNDNNIEELTIEGMTLGKKEFDDIAENVNLKKLSFKSMKNKDFKTYHYSQFFSQLKITDLIISGINYNDIDFQSIANNKFISTLTILNCRMSKHVAQSISAQEYMTYGYLRQLIIRGNDFDINKIYH